MGGTTRKFRMKKLVIILGALLVTIITVLGSSYIIAGESMDQLQQNLEDVANQNALALHNKIHSNHLLLESLSENLHGATPETIEDSLQSFTIFLDKYNLKRFAFAFPDGTSYSTDGNVTNLSYREFFQRGKNGKGTISGVLTDALSEEHGLVNVMTIPIFDENGQVESVFGLTYDSKIFNSALQVHCYDGQGYSCAISEEGQILANFGNGSMQLSTNIFSDVLSKDDRNAETIQKLKQQIEKGTKSSGTMYLSEENYYCCIPMELLDGDVTWYMLTIVPSKVLDSRVMSIKNGLYLMSILVVTLVLIGVFLLILLSGEQRSMMLRFAYEDPLTKGANYARFCVNMEKQSGEPGYLVAMDITNFNNINIAAGKEAGNNMIIDIWEILTSLLQNSEIAGHVRDDMFIMFLQAPDEAGLIERMKQISGAVSQKAKALQVQGIHARYGIYRMEGKELLEDACSKAQVAREYVRNNPEQWYAFYDKIEALR